MITTCGETARPTGGRSAAALKPAIVLAAFGTSEPRALRAIQNIAGRVKAAFPNYEVKLSFTSSIIRQKWRSRLDDVDFRKDYPDISEDFYRIKSPLTTIALLREEGPRPLIVQSLHITNGEEYADLRSVVEALGHITAVQDKNRPFPQIALGRSVLGAGSQRELVNAARALEPLVNQARRLGAALVLMGHGSPHYSNRIYVDLEKTIGEIHQYPIFMGLVDGEPELGLVVEKLNQAQGRNIIANKLYLAPLMLVAGDHARRDMAGPEDGSWMSVLTAAGYEVSVCLEGLGSLDTWADIYVDRLKEAHI